jgi:hypothetical protein
MRRLGTAMALVAGLVVVVGVTLAFQPGRQPLWDGLKRSGSLGPTLQLSAARRQPDQSFQRLDDGARLTSRSVLILRATSSIDGPARVYLQRASQAPVEVGEVALQAGTHELQTDAGLLGVTLDGERGAVKVWVVVGEVPFSGVLALEAISSQGSRELAAASVSVQVE